MHNRNICLITLIHWQTIKKLFTQCKIIFIQKITQTSCSQSETFYVSRTYQSFMQELPRVVDSFIASFCSIQKMKQILLAHNQFYIKCQEMQSVRRREEDEPPTFPIQEIGSNIVTADTCSNSKVPLQKAEENGCLELTHAYICL